MAAGAAVAGVRFDATSSGSMMFEADLVLDPSGRGALMATLFNRLGLQGPEKTEIGVDHYVSRRGVDPCRCASGLEAGVDAAESANASAERSPDTRRETNLGDVRHYASAYTRNFAWFDRSRRIRR